MTRVGFTLSVAWLGSVNYYRNLLSAILASPARTIEPVFLIGARADATIIKELPSVEVIRSGLFDQFTPRWGVRKASQQFLSRDPLLESLLKKNRIELLSHSDILGKSSHLPALCWIGDFQHRHLPQMFKPSERWFRDHDFRQQCRYATRILLSSNDAQRDLSDFFPSAVEKSRVLQFVAQPRVTDLTPAREALERKYGFSGSYFHIPNQFWAHKDHGVLVDALKLLKQRGVKVQVIATGATEDYRHPGYFDALMRHASDLDVAGEFKVLGLVPYADLVGLMINATALINPSRAEGWSTSVEEAKSLGKRIILSDLPVHLEQAPPDGVYFPVGDAPAVADAMQSVLKEFDVAKEAARGASAQNALPGRVETFANVYENIVAETMSAFHSRP